MSDKVKVRTTFRPDEEIEVPKEEADSLKARGLLASGKTVQYAAAGVKTADAETVDETGSNIAQVEAPKVASIGKQG